MSKFVISSRVKMLLKELGPICERLNTEGKILADRELPNSKATEIGYQRNLTKDLLANHAYKIWRATRGETIFGEKFKDQSSSRPAKSKTAGLTAGRTLLETLAE
jgi:hypothetical protein